MNIKFSTQHQWIETDSNTPKVGITVHAQDTLGDIVFAQLPQVGQRVAQFAQVCVIESVKAAADVFSPASGEICEVNQALSADPSLLNSDPLGEGWMFKLKIDHPDELNALLNESDYLQSLD